MDSGGHFDPILISISEIMVRAAAIRDASEMSWNLEMQARLDTSFLDLWGGLQVLVKGCGYLKTVSNLPNAAGWTADNPPFWFLLYKSDSELRQIDGGAKKACLQPSMVQDVFCKVSKSGPLLFDEQ